MEEIAKTTEFTCIVCPIGCHITAALDANGKPISIKGNSCPRGKQFVMSELTDPQRVLTSTVRIESARYKLLPVRTDRAIPKSELLRAMDIVNSISLKAPIRLGDVIRENFIVDGCNLIACKSVDE